MGWVPYISFDMQICVKKYVYSFKFRFVWHTYWVDYINISLFSSFVPVPLNVRVSLPLPSHVSVDFIHIRGFMSTFSWFLPLVHPLTFWDPPAPTPQVSVDFKFHSGSFDIHFGGIMSTFLCFPFVAPPNVNKKWPKLKNVPLMIPSKDTSLSLEP